MRNIMKFAALTVAGLLVSTPLAFAQTNGNGTTLAGGDNGKAAKMDETSKDGMMKKDGMKSNGSMMKSDGMKSGMSKDGMKTDGKM